MGKDCLAHSIAFGGKLKRWNWRLGLEEEQRGAVPKKRMTVSVIKIVP